MTIQNCLANGVAGGEITQDEADAMARLHAALTQHYGNTNQATAEIAARLMNQAAQQRRAGLLADAARQRVEGFVTAYRNARGEPDPAAAMVALIEHNGLVQMPAGMSSVVGRSNAIMGLAQGQLEELLHEFRRTWVTGQTRNTARLENLVREAAGQGTGDPAAAGFARAWLQVAEDLRSRFNAAGGAIGQLNGWFLPQVHNRLALMGAGFDTWRAYIEPRLDMARMRHPLTGGPMTPADLQQSLRYIFDNITSDGWLERQATATRRGLGAISNQRAEARFLHFRNADTWLEYNREFGGGANPFAAMMDHIRGMSEDIAAMEILGPNPSSTLLYVQNFVMRQASLRAAHLPAHFPAVSEYLGRPFEKGRSWLASKDPEDYARSMIKLSTDMWDMYRGSASAVNERIADVFGAVRNMNVASKLGGAALSAVTDVGFQQIARAFAGLPVLRTYDQILQSFATGTKRELVAGGMILDTATRMLHAEARWAGTMQGPEWTQFLADRTIAWSGLQAWTQSGKHAFGLAFMGELASRTAQDFTQLPLRLRRTMQRYGLTATDWDAMRLDGTGQPRAVELLQPSELGRDLAAAGRGGENIAERYLEMILQEREYSTPEGTLRAKANAYGGLERGEVKDEVFRSFGQFKMFGLSVAMLQSQRIATEMVQNGFWRGAGYAVGLLITTTLYGALAMQLKEMAKGKDPRPMNNMKFIGGAILQGGGLGIYGDFLAAEQNRMGGGLARTVVGPTGDLVAGLLSLTSGNVAEYLQGEKTNTGRELIRFLGQNTPGGSLWYLRSAYERVVLQQLQRMVDPEASAAFRRQMQKQKKDYGNGFWWDPGATAPKRGPRLAN